MDDDLWKSYFALLIDFEGSVFENDPDDPGGATKYGIDHRSHPGVNIRSLTLDQAEKIYLDEFAKSAASRLLAPLSFAYFDLAVNAGESRAAKTLQRSLGVQDDGIVGPQTIGAAMAASAKGEAGALLLRFKEERERFYQNLAHANPKSLKFLDGWLDRARRMHWWAAARL